MKLIILIVTIMCFLVHNPTGTAQTVNEVEGQKYTIHFEDPNPHYTNVENNDHEMDVLFTGLFLFYKSFISSQDANKCSFHPSCSQYGMDAVKVRGPMLGIISTLDRLGRCNGLSPENYHIHPETGLLYDPVEQ